MASGSPKLAMIGCTGPIGQAYIDGFKAQGISLRVLARDPQTILGRHPGVEVAKGSMMKVEDVTRTLSGVDAAFLLTPMGLRNDPALEIDAARVALEAAKTAKLKHLIYTSILNATERPRVGVAVLDAKRIIERMIQDSGVPYSILRTGSYMEDVFDTREALLRKGRFLFPVTKSRKFNYTSQADVAPFVAQELLAPRRVLNRAFNFVSPGAYSVTQVEDALSAAAGHTIQATPKFPTYYLFLAMIPLFNLQGHRFSSIIPLIRYFDRHGYEAVGETVEDLFPAFRMTSLEEHLGRLLK